ncbi:MAG: HEAT repeat domain-containing protein [Isosphaeraceae bacterium]
MSMLIGETSRRFSVVVLAAVVTAISWPRALADEGDAEAEEAMYLGRPASYWSSALKAEDPWLRWRAVRALSRLGVDDQARLGGLAAALGDKDVRVRLSAAEALAGIDKDTRAFVPQFTRALGDSAAGARQLDDLKSYVTKRMRALSGGDQEPTLSIPSTVRSFALSRP